MTSSRPGSRRGVGLGIVVVTAASLAGCGSPAPTAPARTATLPKAPTVYTVNGEAHLVIRRKAGRQTQGLMLASGVRALGTVSGLGYQVAAVRTDRLDAAIAALRADPSIQYVEPAYRMTASTIRAARFQGLGLTPDDPLFPSQYAPQAMHAPEAWGVTRGLGTTIAVVDTGIDPGHPEFAGKIVGGYNAFDHSSRTRDDNGHGTHCAGIAAARADNGIGVAGIAPEARIMPIKALDADGAGSDVQVSDGIAWAADHGATVVSLSLGGPGASQLLADAISYAVSRGVVVVAAMGNAGTGDLCYPAAAPGAIAVGAIGPDGTVAGFSQWGSWISVVAPGVSILSTMPTYPCTLTQRDGYTMDYAVLDGTSMAAPAVAGVAALIKARFGLRMSPEAVKAQLERTADHLDGLMTFDQHLGYGCADAAMAVR